MRRSRASRDMVDSRPRMEDSRQFSLPLQARLLQVGKATGCNRATASRRTPNREAAAPPVSMGKEPLVERAWARARARAPATNRAVAPPPEAAR